MPSRSQASRTSPDRAADRIDVPGGDLHGLLCPQIRQVSSRLQGSGVTIEIIEGDGRPSPMKRCYAASLPEIRGRFAEGKSQP